jgi:CRISPR-associated endonuclease Csn1
MKPYDSDYGAFSHKAIKKILPLMRLGNYWNEASFDKNTINRIDKLIVGEYDENIKTRVREKTNGITNVADCRGLPLWLASYIVYDRHSEAKDTKKWKTPNDIELYLKNEFRQHELRNPIVEQVITETLRVVKDIWVYHGKSAENYFDEIHIELGRDMKNPANKRKSMTEKISENENTNSRIKALLEELKNENAKIKPYSPSQQEILKLYEEGLFNNEEDKEKLLEINKIRKASKPTSAEIKRYKLWLEQGYISPYTGATIPLSDLFSNDYEIEHIFPQSRFFDDSMQNKVICEAAVNTLKDNMTAMEFMESKGGSIVSLGKGKSIKLLTKENYQQHINTYFNKNKNKAKNLLSVEVPESFINRQMNDSRYISKVVKNLMSRIVREDSADSKELEVTSKNVIPITGSITSRMKQDWGLNDVWNDIITPRFERLNKLNNSTDFGQWENKKGKQVFQTTVPEAIAKGFSKKRIDHRHHALDALVIACVTRNHINYLNNLNAKETENIGRIDLKNTLCFKDKQDDKGNYKWTFKKPWATFTQDAKNKLETTIVSFKQNIRVINKTNNKYQKWVTNKDGVVKKELVPQTKGDNWAIRKPLHKETVYGKVNLWREKETSVTINAALDNIENIKDKAVRKQLQEIAKTNNNDLEAIKKYLKANPLKINDEKITKVQMYETITATASRVLLDASFDKAKIEKITDTAIQKILMAHLALPQFNNVLNDKGKETPPNELAFSEDGLDTLNKNLLEPKPFYGFAHKPIYKVRVFEEGNRFAIGTTGNKKDKFVEGAKGANLFGAIYANENGDRNYESIPLNIAIERQKEGLNAVPETDLIGSKLLMTLSPNDLVYLPTLQEINENNFVSIKSFNSSRIYKMVSFSGTQFFFLKHQVAISIANKIEFSSLNKMEKSIDEIMIKKHCIKMMVTRIGIIKNK